RDEVGHALLHDVDHELHAVGRIDHEDDVEAPLLHEPDEVAEAAAEAATDPAAHAAARADAGSDGHAAAGRARAAKARYGAHRIDLRCDVGKASADIREGGCDRLAGDR